MQVSIDGDGHLSYEPLNEEQIAFLQAVQREHLGDGRPTLAQIAADCIDAAREVWEGEGNQDGP